MSSKYMVLGVAFGWGRRKGLDVFIELSKLLDENDYKIVLVGTDSIVDQFLPQSIISIHRTQNQNELAELYSAADVLVNPTREDNYPTVNMEAIACGTPVVTFKTGGSPEIVSKKTGSIIECNDVMALKVEIERICREKPFKKDDCLIAAKAFDKWIKFKEYAELYNKY